jgi:hypothetical protein
MASLHDGPCNENAYNPITGFSKLMTMCHTSDGGPGRGPGQPRHLRGGRTARVGAHGKDGLPPLHYPYPKESKPIRTSRMRLLKI